ncbi:MAG TPA: PHP domain-containing protein [Myxococcales bacterium]|nr:PHP domain-containing protein [Myxococcales bacterium]
MIDLHSHTLHSDGDRSPAQLFAEAAAAGVTVLSVTDHDTVLGLDECRAASTPVGVRFVPGIELSCELHGREVHVLGHFIDPQGTALERLASDMLEERRERMERMVALAQGMGFSAATMERVMAVSGGDNLGRPHLARVLVDCGHALSVKDAFDKFLHNGGPLWVDRRRLPVDQAVWMVHQARGTATIAHPGANGVTRQELKTIAELGLDGVEAFHPDHPPNQAESFARIAADLGLLITAGSDYHGPSVQPDRKLGDRTLPADRFAALEERASRYARQ